LQEIVPESFDARSGEVRELHVAERGVDVQSYMLLVRLDRRALALLAFYVGDPVGPGLGHRDALGPRRMNALAHIDFDCRLLIVGVLLALKCLDMPVTLLVGVVGNPRHAFLAASRRPRTLSDRHDTLLCSRWKYVALCCSESGCQERRLVDNL